MKAYGFSLGDMLACPYGAQCCGTSKNPKARRGKRCNCAPLFRRAKKAARQAGRMDTREQSSEVPAQDE